MKHLEFPPGSLPSLEHVRGPGSVISDLIQGRPVKIVEFSYDDFAMFPMHAGLRLCGYHSGLNGHTDRALIHPLASQGTSKHPPTHSYALPDSQQHSRQQK